MIRQIIRLSLRFRFLVIGVSAALIILSADQLRDMPVDVFPEFAPPRVEIQTPCLGLSASEVESLVTVPLEQALNGMPGLEVIRSDSVPQLSSIRLLFERGTDLLSARQLVQERLATVTPTLPTWAAPPSMRPPLSATSRIMIIGLISEEFSLIEMSTLARYKIRPRLLQVPGVAKVALWGQRQQQLQVQVDPERLRDLGVSLNEVVRVTGDALDAGLLPFSEGALIGTGGFIETANQRLIIRHVSPIITPPNLARVPIRTEADGRVLKLSDVAKVLEGHQPLIGDAIINGGPGLMLIVEKFPWANTLEVTEGVEKALVALQPGLTGIEVDATIFRPATFIEMAINNLTRALILGCLLVAFVLALFLFEWRTALVSIVAIPMSLMAAVLVLYLMDATANVMMLAGLVIAVGVVIDDAIIDIENIVRRLRQHRQEGTGQPTGSTILNASLEVRSAIIHATLIDVTALLPVFLMAGLSGSFFQPLALSYALAVIASMFVALTVTPALALIFLSNAPLENPESPFVRWLKRGYGIVLPRFIQNPKVGLAVIGFLGLFGVVIGSQLGQSLMPAFKERDFLMHWLGRPGTSLPEMKRITEQVSAELQALQPVRNLGAHLGQALFADEVVGVDFGEIWVSVDREADFDSTLASIQDIVDGYPGLYRDVQTYFKERIREVLTGSSEAIVVRIYGKDLTILREKAQEVRQKISVIDGIVDLHVELQVDEPTIEIEVDLAAAQTHGLKPGDVRRAASIFMAGLEVGDQFREGKAFDVQVWSQPETRHNLLSVRALLLDTPSGDHVRLEDVADVRLMPNPNIIKREATSRRIDVSANVQGRALGDVARDVELRVKEVEFPLEYHAEILGEYKERQSAQTRMLIFGGVAGIGIFLLLQAAFGSWRLALIAFVTLPIALVGALMAAMVNGAVVSLGSLVGFFTVMGIAARNGIMLITHYQHLEREEGRAFGPELMLRGARERLAPILMTALATAFAVLPLVFLGEVPGNEIEYPMAVVILGGLVTSTLLNLFIMPSLYMTFSRRNRQAN